MFAWLTASFAKKGKQEEQPCAHSALRSQAKKVATVQRAHALFNSMTASPGRAEVTVAELRVRPAFLHVYRMPCAAVAIGLGMLQLSVLLTKRPSIIHLCW